MRTYAGADTRAWGGFTIALFVQCLMSMDKKLMEWEKEHGDYYDA